VPPDADQEKGDMNKGDLINAIANETSMSKAGAGAMINAFVGSVTEALKKGEKVRLKGFGTFSVSHRATRMARNPHTGEAIQIQARNFPKFKASIVLKAAVK